MPPAGTIVVVMGVSGSGKTTIAERLAAAEKWTLLEGDSFHPPANVAKMKSGTPLTDEAAREAGRLAAGAVDPPGSIHASAAYLRHLTGTLVERALLRAWERAT